MSYIKTNKEAWEHAFKHRSGHYAEDITQRLLQEENPFFEDDFYSLINKYHFKEKTVGQFCTNNGRELLQLSLKGVKQAIGFDIAKSMVDYSNSVAQKLNIPAKFVETDILKITKDYYGFFDYGLITVGALPWFEDLDAFFNIVSKTLKPNATLFIHEAHPLALMLPSPGEEAYSKRCEKQLTYPYFGKKIWQEHSMGYMSNETSKEIVFTSFSHTLSDIFTALIKNDFEITLFKEYDYCVGNMFNHLDNQSYPLSMVIIAKKIKA